MADVAGSCQRYKKDELEDLLSYLDKEEHDSLAVFFLLLPLLLIVVLTPRVFLVAVCGCKGSPEPLTMTRLRGILHYTQNNVSTEWCLAFIYDTPFSTPTW